MFYQKFQPKEILSAFVECYFVWESEGPLEKELIVESPPSSFGGIVINYKDPYFLQNKKYDRLNVPPHFVAGLSTYSYKLFLQGTIGMAGIVFKPAALATLFGVNGFELTEERVNLYTVFTQPYVANYVEQLVQAPEPRQKAMHLEELLLHHISIHQPAPDYIDKAANYIQEKNGMLHVYELLKDSYMSRRTFERRFLQKVGLSPKYYARIRRISYIFSLIAGKKQVNWADVFYEAEFYDQAHFIKDFEEFSGRTPQQYLLENTELANFVQKPTTQRI